MLLLNFDGDRDKLTSKEKIDMCRLSLRLLIGILTFTIGIIAASIWRPSQSQPSVVVATPVRQERAYITGNHYDAVRGALQEFRSSDGMNFKKWTITCGSPEGARREMQKILKKAIEIVNREPDFDAQGNQIGEDIIAVFPGNDGENGVASSFHVGESEYLIQVTSTSLKNILAYRNDFKR